MKSCRILIAAFTTVGLATIPACEHRPTTTTAPTTTSQLIEQAESGSESALEQLEALSASSELAQHSDAIGQAATRIAKATTDRFDEEHPLLMRWQQLFLDSNPIANASQATRLEFAKANIHFELIAPTSIDPGREHDIGVTRAVALRHTKPTPTIPIKITYSYDNFYVDESNIFAGVSQISNADIPPSGMNATTTVTNSKVLVSEKDTPGQGTPVSLRCEVQVRVMDHRASPPAVFAEWTEDLRKTASISGI